MHLSFNINPGPKVKIREVVFDGNNEVSDGELRKQMKSNKPRGMLGFITGGGTYLEDKFAEDAQAIQSYFRDKGYVFAQVGQPQIEPLEDSADGKTLGPVADSVDERDRYRVKSIGVEGNKNLPSPRFCPCWTRSKSGNSTRTSRSGRATRSSGSSTAARGSWTSPCCRR